MDTVKMRACAPLLPEPGNEVVVQCLDEIERLRGLLKRARVPIGCDDIPTVQSCPHCDKPLEVGIDQIARKSDFFTPNA